MIGFVKLRILDTDENFTLRGVPLAKAMEEDRASGLVPFFVSATLGTTSCCSFDALNEIGPICQSEGSLPTESLLRFSISMFKLILNYLIIFFTFIFQT